MNKLSTTIMMLMLSIPCLHAQKEGNVWTFGIHAGIDFNSGTPQAITTSIYNSAPIVNEGCASICDASGKLLFYTDGSVIYNRNHSAMPNGNLGINTASTTQGALIVPLPGSEYLYYVFSLEPSDLTSNQQLYYSIVDMRLNNGLGDVQQNNKVIFLADSLSERMTAVAGDNCDVWIVVRFEYNKVEYRAYRLTSDGLNTVPVISAITNSTSTGTLGQPAMLKFSNNRHKLASARRGSALLGIADFNPATGSITNNEVISSSAVGGYYGVCFSPDDTKLYVTTGFASPSQLIQYNLSAGNLAAIQASATVLYTHNQSGSGLGDIKEGSDGKLYFVTSTSSVWNSTAVSVINNPNLTGAQSQVMPNIITLAPGTLSGHGLPNQIVVLPVKDTDHVQHGILWCGEPIQLPVDTTGGFYEWENGNKTYRRVVSKPGIYVASYRKGCTLIIDTFHVREAQFPQLNVPETTCGDGYISFEAIDTFFFSYVCRDASGTVIDSIVSDKGAVFQPLKAGSYKVTVRVLTGNCKKEFEVNLHIYPSPHIMVSPEDTTVFYGDEVQLRANGTLQYLWMPADPLKTDATIPNPIAQLFKPTIFTVVGTNEYGCSDTAYVKINIDYALPDFIPNAFSPNGDGINDVFNIAGLTYQQVTSFRVFNRYGQEVFFSRSAEKGWDGTFNGKKCDEGSYYYLIELRYPSGEQKVFRGDVTLLR